MKRSNIHQQLFYFIFMMLLLTEFSFAQENEYEQFKSFYGTTIMTMAKHPSGKIFAGTNYDGLYVSEDEGNSWKLCFNGNTKTILLSILSLAIDNNGIMYIGSADNGLLKSTDEGLTWNYCVFPALSEQVACVSTDSRGNVYVGTKKGIYVSKDTALTWTKIFDSYISEWQTYETITKIVVKDDIIYAAVSSRGLFISSDHGDNWTESQLPPGWYYSLFVMNSQEIFLAIHAFLPSYPQGLYKTDDGGKTWRKLTNGFEHDQINCLQQNSDNSIIAGGILGTIYKSTNEGDSWTKLTSGMVGGNINALIVSGNKIIAGSYYGGILKTVDGGENWKYSNYGFNRVTDQCLTKLNDGAFLVANQAGIFRYSEDGEYTGLNNLEMPMGPTISADYGSFVSSAFIKTKYNSVILSTYQGGFWKTTDDGKSWKILPVPSDVSMIMQFVKSGKDDLYFTALLGSVGIYSSSDDGNTWNRMVPYSKGVISVAADSFNNIYAGGSRVIFASKDAGVTWQLVHYGFYGDVTSLKISASKDVYALTADEIMKSTNAGYSWSSYSIAGARQILEISDGHFLITTEKGFYESTNNGLSWFKRNDEMADKTINRVFRTDDGNFYVITSEGIFKYDIKDLSTGVFEEKIPAVFILHQNYPNPFNPTTTINYSIPSSGNVQVKVYDMLGREVAALVNEYKSAGNYNVVWNANNVSSGIYFYSISYNGNTLYKKMILLK